MTVLDQCRDKMREFATLRQLDGAAVTVRGKQLTPEEAIGTPTRRDYPILEGRERVIESTVPGTLCRRLLFRPRGLIVHHEDVSAVIGR